MVRSIKSCSACGLRFVSHGAGNNNSNNNNNIKKTDRCSSCSNYSETKRTPIDSQKQDSNKENEENAFRRDSHVEYCNSIYPKPQEEDSGSCGSEGGDDFHCTQIIESQESIDQDETETEKETELVQAQNVGGLEKHSITKEAKTIPVARVQEETILLSNDEKDQPLCQRPNHGEKTKIALSTTTTTTTTVTNASSSGDICFICGADLSRLKRRIDHIKRCSKKHGITGRDVRLDVRHGTESHSTNDKTPRANSSTQITDREGDETKSDKRVDETPTGWHGDAEKLLKLTKQDQRQTISRVNISKAAGSPPNSSGTTKAKKSVSSWTDSGYNAKAGIFVPPSATRNLNNVLMAGSRRLEVTARAAQKRGEIETGGKGGNGNTKRSKYSNWNCPMYKKITGTDFVVDGFHYAKHSLTKSYFLTHFHSDHYGGITSSWDVGTIYCSLPTASLVSQQLRVDKKHIHPLPMNTPTVIETRGKAATVTLLDANHCPGAVMFLFEVGRRTILHVGDFRWSRDAMLLRDASSPLHKIVSQKVVLDELYLDTTYCNEKYHLPPQADAIKATIETFAKELKRCNVSNPKKRTLHLFGAYTIGKEKIYLSVAEHFGLKVYVDKSRYKILSTLNLPEEYNEVLTTNRELSDIWVVPMGHLNMKKMPEYFAIANSKPFAPAYDRIVGYRPTGWSLSRSDIISSRSSGNVTIHSVPYSEHSSFPELIDCLACLKPAKIIPTVGASKSNEQVRLLLQGLRNKQNAIKMFSKKT